MTATLVTVAGGPHTAIHYLDAEGIACGHTNHDGTPPDVTGVATLPEESYGSWADTMATLTAAHVPLCRVCRRCWRGVNGAVIPAHSRACWRTGKDTR